MSLGAKDTLPPGTVISGFRIESLVGRGAMAAVYRALQLNLERTVALKVLPSEFASDKDFVERFFNEARAAAVLSHPSIVQAYDAGITDDNTCYFAMEFVEGENLLDKVDREGPMPCAMALQIMLDMARALSYGWHSQRLNHGDLKPANIMLKDRGDSKLADFGLAKTGDWDFDGDGIMLTPLYAAPELILGKAEKNDCRPDIYSFGATLYHLISGFPPFPGDDPEEVMDKQVYAPLTPLIQQTPRTPRPVSLFVDCLLSKEPGKRPQSWDHVIARLQRLLKKNMRGIAVATAAAESPKSESQPEKKKFKFHFGKASRSVSRTGRRRREKTYFWMLTAIIVLLAANLLGLYLYWLFNVRDSDSRVPVPEEVPAPLTEAESRPPPLAPAEEFETPPRIETEVPTAAPEPEPDPEVEEVPPPPPPDAPEAMPEEVMAQRRRQAGDQYTEFIYEFTRQPYSPVRTSLEPWRQVATEWLAAHPEDGREQQRMLFIREELLPAAENLRAQIIDHKAHFKGMSLPELEHRQIHDIDEDGVTMVMRLEDPLGRASGQATQRMGWSELRRPEYYIAWAERILGTPGIPAAERQPYLALLAMLRRTEALRRGVAGLPASDNREMWRQLTLDLERAETNWRALEIWREALARHEAGAVLAAHQKLQELQAVDNIVLSHYRAQIADLEETLQARLPGRRADDMIESARDKLAANPSACLILLAAANARYGRLDHAEKAAAERLRRRAVRALSEARPPMPDEAVDFWHDTVPLLASHQRQPAGWSLVRHQRIFESDQVPEHLRPLLDAYAGLALLECGFWAEGRQRIARAPAGLARRAPNHHWAAFVFSRDILSWSALARRPAVGNTISELLALGRNTEHPPHRAMIATLALEAATITGQLQLPETMWPKAQALWRRNQRDLSLKRYIMLYLAWLIEAGHQQRAQEVVAELNTQLDLLFVAGFSIREWESVVGVTAHLSDHQDAPEPNLPDSVLIRDNHDAYARMLYAALIKSREADGAQEQQCRRELVDRLFTLEPPATMIGGYTWLSLLHCRLAEHLTKLELAEARELLESALAVKRPATNPHYPALLLLKAGVEVMKQRPLVAAETLQHLQWTTVASSTQRKLADYDFSGDLLAGDDFSDNEFWSLWLRFTALFAEQDWERARMKLEHLREIAHYPRHQRLVSALDRAVTAAADQP